MLKILLGILVLFLLKFSYFTPSYPDALIILVLSASFLTYKFLEDRNIKSLSKDSGDSIRNEINSLKDAISAIKLGKGLNGR